MRHSPLTSLMLLCLFGLTLWGIADPPAATAFVQDAAARVAGMLKYHRN